MSEDTSARFPIGRWLGMLHYHHKLFIHERMAPYGLPEGAIPILFRLLHDDPPSQDELTQHSLRDKASISRLLRRLEAAGFVTRQPDPHDERVKRVHPTEKARALAPVVRACLAEWNEILTRGLTDEERSTVWDLLRRMAENSATQAPCARWAVSPDQSSLNTDAARDGPEADR